MTPEQAAEIEIILRPIVNRLANMVARGLVSRTGDGGDLQTLQIGVLDSQTIDGAERFQQYGVSSVPLTGAEAVVIFPGGDAAHPLVIAVDDRRHRPKGLKAGEVTIYNNAGASVLLTEDGDIICEPKAGRKLYVKRSGGSTAAVASVDDVDSIYTAITTAATGGADGGAAYKAAMKVLMDIDRPYGVAALESE